MSNFTFFYNVFYALCILKSLNSHISVVVCNFFEFGTVPKWCIREWVKNMLRKADSAENQSFSFAMVISLGKLEKKQISFGIKDILESCSVKKVLNASTQANLGRNFSLLVIFLDQ